MSPETKRRVFRYGIAIDLVILASGVGLLIPTSPVALTIIYVTAVALAAWKGGWEGAWTAIILSAWLLPFLFDAFNFSHLFGFVAASIAAAAIVRSRFITRMPRPAFAGSPPRPDVVSFENVQGDIEQSARERKIVATTLERTASQQLEAVRLAAIEKARVEREAEQRARVEAEEESRRAVEEAVQRAAAEKHAAEADAQRRADEERRRVEEEAQQRLAAEEEAQPRIEEEARRVSEEEALRAAAEKVAAEAEAQRRIEEERWRTEAAQQRLAVEAEARRSSEEEARRALEEERRRTEEEAQQRVAAEAEARRASEEEARRALEEERRRIEIEARERADEERRLAEQQAQELLETERRAAEAELQQRLAAEREAIRVRLEEQLAAERQALEKEAAEKLAASRAAAKPPGPGIVATVTSTVSSTVSGWFQRVKPRGVNLKKKTAAPPASRRQIMAPPRATASRRAPSTVSRQPRLLMLERRRGTADTIVAKIRQQGVEIAIVERLVDAVDELFRFHPDVILIDTELSDFEKSYRTIADQNPNLPIALTGRSGGSAPAGVRSVGYFGRPFDANELAALATKAMSHPAALGAAPASRPVAVAERAPRPAMEIVAPPPRPAAPKEISVVKSVSENEYEVVCFNCRTGFDAVDADWCSCLAKERTLVCTNCLTCFCKAPPAYKEKFWLTAPPRLFERKSGENRRQGGLPTNSEPEGITRPLVLTVEDDEDIQAIIARVCKNLGYGFIYATNGLDGLALARQYRPNLILSDAFMPKLDGREMCRMLREESPGADWRMVVMTGLYTDTKYRSEAVKRFHIDDYIAKPVAITELINLLQKHLDGVSGPPVQDVDLHELHRQDYEEETEGIALADVLVEEERREAAVVADTSEPALTIAKPKPKRAGDDYEICCFNCSHMFDATRAEWCTCVGRDQTLVCPSCTGCFCKAPAAYKERFWMDAPPSLFERKMIGSKRHLSARSNPTLTDVKRPLILLVEDDENVQLIVKTVVTSMGYGFIAGANGQEGLALAREYNPDLILSDAFMPKLDGREMCRLLKEDPATARARAIIMTGLYTDRKYRNEALDYFKVDDYVAKPLAVDDLIKLFKKHLPHEVQTTM